MTITVIQQGRVVLAPVWAVRAFQENLNGLAGQAVIVGKQVHEALVPERFADESRGMGPHPAGTGLGDLGSEGNALLHRLGITEAYALAPRAGEGLGRLKRRDDHGLSGVREHGQHSRIADRVDHQCSQPDAPGERACADAGQRSRQLQPFQ